MIHINIDVEIFAYFMIGVTIFLDESVFFSQIFQFSCNYDSKIRRKKQLQIKIKHETKNSIEGKIPE